VVHAKKKIIMLGQTRTPVIKKTYKKRASVPCYIIKVYDQSSSLIGQMAIFELVFRFGEKVRHDASIKNTASNKKKLDSIYKESE